MIWLGERGTVTPIHFDENHNFYMMLSGSKRAILYHPKWYEHFYPHPKAHPSDRASLVNIHQV
jgi:lysine-specific demethylase 8